MVYDTFQYVSIEATLRSLMQNKAYVELLLQNNSQGGGDVMREYQHGNKYQSALHDLSKLTISIQLFYDGMGTANPLRGQSSLCNVGVFYFTVKNLPTSYSSCHANVHLLALCYSHDLRVYGYDAVLDKFVSEIEHLRVHGFEGTFALIGTQRVYVELAQVVCDNLALNGLFGFIECFAVDYFCTICLATQSEIQTCFHESEFQRRTVSLYDADVENINAGRLTAGRSHSHGVKKYCALNKIGGFHITENYALDPMHVLLEGVIPVELSCVLYQLTIVKKFFTLAYLNSCFISFFSKNFVDRKNKPPELSSVDVGTLSPSMKAMQMWTLLRYLPAVMGHKVPMDDEHWTFMLHLLELVDIVFAPAFTKAMVKYLEQHITDHLSTFVQLFGESVRLKPKHHLLVHLPSIVMHSGPVIGMSCLRYELKNSFFKRSADVMCNFTNVCKTLAYRHQYCALYATLSGHHCRNFVTPGKTHSLRVCDTPFCESLCDVVQCEGTDAVLMTTSLHRSGLRYKAGCYFVVGLHDLMLVFGKAICFVTNEQDQWYLVAEAVDTMDYDSHTHSYVVAVCTPVRYMTIPINDVRDPHALFGHEVVFGNLRACLITMRSHVM